MPTNEEHVTGVKIHTFPNETVENDALVTGLKTVNGALRNVNFTFATILTWVRQKIADFYIPLSTKGSANGVASLDGAGKVTDTQIPFSSNNPLMDGTASAGTATTLSRSDHRHPSDTSKISTSEKGAASGVASLGNDGKVPSAQLPTIPSASSATPQNLGTAAAGSSTDYSRADHVHSKPSASDVGAQPTITANGILKGNGAGGVSAATAGTDYQTPLTAGTDYATPAQLATKAPFSAGIFPGTSSTAGGTQAKVGTVPDLSGLTALYDGLTICMTFANAQTYDGQPTLDIGIPYNGVTAFGINRTSASAAGIYDWGNGSAVDLVFDATNTVWVMKKGQHGSAVRYGVLLLSDSVSENSTESGGKASTPAAVKAAYDLAFEANTRPVLPYWLDYGTISSLPQTIPEEVLAGDTVDYFELGNPSAMGSPWTVTTADGSLTISGTCLGITSLRLHMTHNQ